MTLIASVFRLPAGGITVMENDGLVRLARLRDIAAGEVVEVNLGPAVGIRVEQRRIGFEATAPDYLDLTPELRLARLHGATIEEVKITSDRPVATPFELRLQLLSTAHVAHADQPMEAKDGRPIFRLTIPADASVSVRYEVDDR